MFERGPYGKNGYVLQVGPTPSCTRELRADPPGFASNTRAEGAQAEQGRDDAEKYRGPLHLLWPLTFHWLETVTWEICFIQEGEMIAFIDPRQPPEPLHSHKL